MSGNERSNDKPEKKYYHEINEENKIIIWNYIYFFFVPVSKSGAMIDYEEKDGQFGETIVKISRISKLLKTKKIEFDSSMTCYLNIFQHQSCIAKRQPSS